MLGPLSSPFFIAFLSGAAAFYLWYAITKRSREIAMTAAERRLEKVMRESGEVEGEVDMATTIAKPPTLIEKTVAVLTKQGAFQTLEQGDVLSWINRRLILAGSPKGWTGAEFLAFYFLIVGLSAALGIFLFVSGVLPSFLVAGVVIVGAAYPFAWLNRLVKTRQERAFTELPDFLDELVLALSSGMDTLDKAFERVIIDAGEQAKVTGKKRILVEEFGRAYREYKYGNRDQEDALKDAADRLGVPEVDQLVEGINEAKRSGSPILDTLQAMSTHIYSIYQQKMLEYIEKKSSSFIVSLVMTMLGVMVIIVAPIMAQVLTAFSGG